MRDYTTVTETPDDRITKQALAMMLTRYELAAGYGEGRDVLEVACGAGQGLGYIARRARTVTGGDCTWTLVQRAVAHYRSRIPVLQFDAHRLPFADGSMDVVVLFEAVYYLQDFGGFLEECKRVLRRPGILLISTANPERPDFNPSPFSQRYYSAAELESKLRSHGFSSEVLASYWDRKKGRECVVSLMKRVAVRLGVIPRTMKGKELLKRIFLGRLVPMPVELEPGTSCSETPLRSPMGQQTQDAKVVYAVGTL